MTNPRIAVIGLGYVGLPLAVGLARHFTVLGFDINQERVKELRAGVDRTNEVDPYVLKEVKLKVSADVADLKGNEIFIITVPTPVDESNRPDLGAVIAASRTVGGQLGRGAIVVFESTVWPGVTEAGVFEARNIKTAEAAKVIENAQRDINIAFINEVTQIFSKIGVSVWDVLDAARTKWNFLGFEPGLVGGHCIGVDPYYLSHLAQELGHDPRVILSGRGTNDGMGQWIADALHERRKSKAGRALVLGLTFKENVPDIRNSRAIDVIRRLEWLGHDVHVADPFADPAEVEEEYDIKLTEPNGETYDLVVGAVAHQDYRELSRERLAGLLAPGGTLADLKGIWRDRAAASGMDYWTL
jgi:UDP-N-acetyl-D-mannosaminuronate dehydrogenase